MLSLDTVAKVGDGQATKILFPFEFSRLVEGASEYLGSGRQVPDRQLNSLDDLEKQIGTMDDILGPIPKQEELVTEIKSIEQEIAAESASSTEMISSYGGSKGGRSAATPGLPDPIEMTTPEANLPTPSVVAPPTHSAPTVDARRRPPPAAP